MANMSARRPEPMTDQPIRIRTKAEEALADHFAALTGDDPMREIRAAAFDAFLQSGLPHRRIEDWKYTDLRSLIRDVPAPARPAAPADARAALDRSDTFAAMDRARIVFVNGHFVPALSDMAGIESDLDFASFGRFLAQGGAILDRSLDPAEAPVFALNSAFVRDGAVIRIRHGAKLARPLEIAHVFAGDEPGLQTLRHQVTVGPGAEATILQTFSGPDGVALPHQRRDRDAGRERREAALDQRPGGGRPGDPPVARPAAPWRRRALRAVRVRRRRPRVAQRVARRFRGGAAREMGLRGATIARGRQHMDTTLIVDHAAPRCGGQEYFKAAMDGQSQGVFQGKIIVEPGAQKTDSKMMSRALLLSADAEFANKPELEIFADDVVCGHGATCGRIDENMLFFMRSRGIEKPEAERMLVQAFLADAIELIGDEAIVEALEARTARWLGMDAEAADAA